MNAIAIIPARSGSKGLPGKNIKKLGGLPLLGWGIKATLASKILQNTIISTDSEAYFKIAKSINPQILWHIRTPELSEDVPTEDVILDILEKMNEKFIGKELLVIIQPTTPFLTGKDIDNCIQLMNENPEFNSCISVKSVSEFPEWIISSEDGIKGKSKKLSGTISVRQNLIQRWIANGGIYVVKKKFLLNDKKIIDENGTLLYKMSKLKSIDIDDIEDFEICQALVENKKFSPEN